MIKTEIYTNRQGLQGDVIIMNRGGAQGTKHSEALKKDQEMKGLNSFTAVMKYKSSYKHLLENPDYDVFATIAKGISKRIS